MEKDRQWKAPRSPPSISPPIRGLSKNGGFGRKAVPSSGGVSWTPLPQGVPLFRWLSGAGPNFLTSVELQPCAAIWTTIKRQRWASMVAQTVPRQPENAVAFVSPSLALRLFQSHRDSIWSDGSASV